ncbi:MAG: TrbG/VirB9 family P-type conjugative transfer protein [Novosphingobium sp.]|nr:TrbG/VirB9 family P-type conjugative transfer protein [Novosphingobium sp.]
MKTLLKTAVAGLALMAAMPAHADDDRLATRAYSADEVVRIDGRLGVQATVAFAEDEHIENVAVGDSASWQITPNKRANLLFVKPLSPKARTNMTVITDRHRYYFDLVASPAGKPVYVLNFTYPGDPKEKAPAQAAAPLTDDEALAIGGDAAQQPVDPAQLNFAWHREGASKLMPSRIYDDGSATYLTWAAGTPLPAILVRDARGDEGPVNFAVRGDVIVIDDVPDLIVLRAGKASALLENKGEPRKPAGSSSAPTALAAKE